MTKKLVSTKRKRVSATTKGSASTDYQEYLIESLRDHEYAVAYLNAAIEESLKATLNHNNFCFFALKNVAEAQGNMTNLAKRSKIRRESLYRLLSAKGNPYLQSFTSLIHAMGFNIRLY